MPAQTQTNNAATALIIGPDSKLVAELRSQFEKLHIVSNVREDSVPDSLDQYGYVWLFLSDYFLSTTDKQKNIENLKILLKKIEKKQTKLALIARHPNDYYVSPHNQASVFEHQNHILSCIDEAKKNTEVNSRVIVISGLLQGGVKRDTPLFIELPFSELPQKIIETANGNEAIRPLGLEVAVKEIIKTMFSQHSRHQIYELASKDLTTVSSLVFNIAKQVGTAETVVYKTNYSIQKIDFPSTRIELKNTIEVNRLIYATALETINNHAIHTARLVKAPTIAPKPVLVEKKIEKPVIKNIVKKSTKNNKTNPLTYAILGLLIVCVLTILLSPLAYFILIKNTLTQLKNFDTISAQKTSSYAKNLYPLVSKTAYVYVPIMGVVVGGVSSRDMGGMLGISRQVLEIAEQLEQVKQSGRNIIGHIIDSQKIDIAREVSTTRQRMQVIYEQLNTIKASIKTIQAESNNERVKDYFKDAAESMVGGGAYIEDALTILEVGDKLLGLEKQVTYLVLLQNNQELRATGGFIGSFAMLTLDKGKLLDIETYDVYAADGQLRGHVEPPAALKKHLGEANWYLRDSNWDPNFPTTARRAEWFLNKEMGRQVDGTIAIDLFVVKGLLESLGGVELPDYNETINANNIFERAEFHSELNYFNGSTQKKDFLSALINAMYVRLSESKNDEAIQVIASLVKNAQQSHIQVSFRNDELESSFENTVFSGKVRDVQCPNLEGPCLKDYFGVVESNVGVNKVNYFVERTIAHHIKIGEKVSKATTTLDLKNTAESNTWPAGIYKNYIRFVIPSDASIESVRVDGQSLDASRLDVEVRHNKKYVGMYAEVPIAGKISVDLAYQLKNPTESSEGFSLVSLFEKQSGTGEDEVSFEIENTSNLNLWFENGELIETNNHKTSEMGQSDKSFIYKLSR